MSANEVECPAQGCQKFSIVQNLHKLLKSGCCGVLYKDSNAYRWLSAGLQQNLLLSACNSVNLKLCCNDIFWSLTVLSPIVFAGKGRQPKSKCNCHLQRERRRLVAVVYNVWGSRRGRVGEEHMYGMPMYVCYPPFLHSLLCVSCKTI